MPQLLRCYKCGSPNELGVSFCIACGEKFIYNCPQCKAFIEPGSEYCSRCGVKLDWNKQTRQSTAISSEEAFSTPSQQHSLNMQQSQKGINPWLIAFMVVILLIAAIIIIDFII
jgi:uncharacterized membrane protein YvbJ